ncbi:MAG: lipopolysaccharide transport periplasmic protein LptA [Proteobacteria bacterium]|nr:lipopolysaccharide transport periplasmic protein LptA [Pseudomonadota bacterium]MDA1058785.1 lipopolysaccharide transport periplasmic protein LptA [Pseudomonadota bacterium]
MKFSTAAVLALASTLLVAAPAFGQFSNAHDTALPIEIAADALVVQQEQQIAVFSGNVDAQQGNMKLRAEKLWVHYQGDTGGDTAQAISKIDAQGKVFFSSGDETAEGDQGTYDVDNGVIVLTGRVVLTQGGSVIKGNRVVLDLNTGKSTMDGGEAKGDGRVRGLFVPRRSAAP